MNIGVCGISGRMGGAVYQSLCARGHAITAAFDRVECPAFNKPISSLYPGAPSNVFVTAIGRKQLSQCDVVIDFSSPEATMGLLDAAKDASVPVVIGTTGINDEGREKITMVSKVIPVFFTANMSVGVNILLSLTGLAARLCEGFDVEVSEAHHKHKKDAPSGTARMLIEQIKSAPHNAQKHDEYRQNGIIGARAEDEIGVQVIRGGDIVGEHTVYFISEGERIELTHRASDRKIFSNGAVRAAEFLVSSAPGLYSMKDLLGL